MTTTAPARRRHRLLGVLFAIYLTLLVWIVLWKLEVPWVGEAAILSRPIKLIPFVPDGTAGASQPVELVINLALFIPFGLYVGLLAPGWRLSISAAVFAGASLVLETTQHLLSVGSFDVTDVIVNTAGGLVGLGILTVIRRRLHDRIDVPMARALLIGTVVALLAVAGFVASPLHYGPQRDVILPSPTRSG